MAEIDSMGPLIKKNIVLNGIEITLITHCQDKVHGAMLRGEFPLCKSYLALLEALQNTIQPHHQVLDIGANVGSIAIVLAKTQPEATIYCFEPDVLNFSLLNINIILNNVTNVRTFNYALGKHREFIDMYLSTSNFGDHRSVKTTKNDLNERYFTKSASKVEKVNPLEFLTSSLQLEEARHFDLVKIDTQGADFEILEACLPLLKQEAVVAVEYSPYHLEANGTSKDDIVELLPHFSQIQKINPLDKYPRLTDLDLWSLLEFYDDQAQHYSTEYDLLLKMA